MNHLSMGNAIGKQPQHDSHGHLMQMQANGHVLQHQMQLHSMHIMGEPSASRDEQQKRWDEAQRHLGKRPRPLNPQPSQVHLNPTFGGQPSLQTLAAVAADGVFVVCVCVVLCNCVFVRVRSGACRRACAKSGVPVRARQQSSMVSD